jgi:hypothetical protein
MIKEGTMLLKYIAQVNTTVGMPSFDFELLERDDVHAERRTRFLCEQFAGVRWFISIGLWRVTAEDGHELVAEFKLAPPTAVEMSRR